VLQSRKSRAIPLLLVRAIQPAQSLSACTRVQLYLYLIKFLLAATSSSSSVGACTFRMIISYQRPLDAIYIYIRGLLEKYPTFGREKETGLLGALDT